MMEGCSLISIRNYKVPVCRKKLPVDDLNYIL